MATSTAVHRLPADIITRIITHTLHDDDAGSSWEHGGELVGWDSNGEAGPLARVSRAWNRPATALLYQSVDIRGGRAALGFLQVTKSKPELKGLLRSVVVGVGDYLEMEPDGSMGQVPASFTIMELLDACPTGLERLQIRPLHVAVAGRVAAQLARIKPRSLVVVHRVVLPPPPWTAGLFDHVDWGATLAENERLEVDWDQFQDALPYQQAFTAALPIQHLSLRLLCPLEVWDRFYKAVDGATLRVLVVYAEQRFPPCAFSKALAHFGQLRHLRFLCNPPLDDSPPPTSSPDDPTSSPSPPLVDLLLPHLPLLETLYVSSTEISSSVIRLLPPSLRRLKITAFTPAGFPFTSSLAQDMREASHGLEDVCVVDRWQKAEVEEMAKACEERGVKWVYVDDQHELPESSGSGSGSGTGTTSSGRRGSGESR